MYQPGDRVRITQPVPLIGGELSPGLVGHVTACWPEGESRYVSVTFAGGRGVCRLAIELIAPASSPSDPLERLAAAGWTVSPKAFEAACHSVTRGKVRGHFDRDTGRFEIWGTKTVLTLDEACGAVPAEPKPVAATAPNPPCVVTTEQQAWLDRCAAAGFEILDGPNEPAASCVADDRRSPVREAAPRRVRAAARDRRHRPDRTAQLVGGRLMPAVDPQREIFSAAEVGVRLATAARGHAAAPGTGPKEETCGTCRFGCRIRRTSRRGGQRVWRKCLLTYPRWTWSERTEVRMGSPACELFEAASKPPEVTCEKERK